MPEPVLRWEHLSSWDTVSEPLQRSRGSGNGEDPPRFASVGMSEDGQVRVCCENCGSTNLELDGWDIDKCRGCGHWRYR